MTPVPHPHLSSPYHTCAAATMRRATAAVLLLALLAASVLESAQAQTFCVYCDSE